MSESRSRSTSPAVEQENKSEEGAARDARSSRSPSPAAMDRSRSPSIKRQSRSRSRSRSGSRSRSASSASSSSESEDVTEFFDRRRAVRRLKRGERELMQLKQRLVEKECLIVLEKLGVADLELAAIRKREKQLRQPSPQPTPVVERNRSPVRQRTPPREERRRSPARQERRRTPPREERRRSPPRDARRQRSPPREEQREKRPRDDRPPRGKRGGRKHRKQGPHDVYYGAYDQYQHAPPPHYYNPPTYHNHSVMAAPLPHTRPMERSHEEEMDPEDRPLFISLTGDTKLQKPFIESGQAAKKAGDKRVVTYATTT